MKSLVSAFMVYFLIIKWGHIFSIYISLSIMTTTPLSAVRTMQLLSLLRLFRAFPSSLVMLEILWGCPLTWHSIQYSQFIQRGYSPTSNSSKSVITASYLKWTKCHTSGYIKSTLFGHKSFKSSLPTSWAEEDPLILIKMFTHLKNYLMKMNFILHILIHHIRDEHYQSFLNFTAEILEECYLICYALC